jgi:hypothetical protein
LEDLLTIREVRLGLVGLAVSVVVFLAVVIFAE